jgi:hypothetical protein
MEPVHLGPVPRRAGAHAHQPLSLRRGLAALAAAAAFAAQADPTPVWTEVLGPFAGFDAPAHPDNMKPERVGFYGTDLGWSYAHGGRIHFIFGDTIADPKGTRIAELHDDSFGTIDLADWPDPSKISRDNLPVLRIGQVPGTPRAAAIDPGHPMEGLKTPVAAFSNGKREFGLFLTAKPQACRSDAECGSGLSCDTTIGILGERPDKAAGLTLPCDDTTPGCTVDPLFDAEGTAIRNSGLCSDRGSTIWADTPFGRAGAYAIRHLVAIRSEADPARYADTRPWLTNKFTNVVTRAVTVGGAQRVYLWGRPGFIGLNAKGSTLGMYFAWVDMPDGPGFAWDVHYFAGIGDGGLPRYSRTEADAVAVDLDSTQPGVQPREVHDIVQHMSIVWIEPLGKWVMFYGGGISKFPLPQWFPECGVLQVFARTDCTAVGIGNGAIRMRTADHPWGPWTPPVDLIVGGDADARPLEGEYAPGGVLHHPECTAPSCQAPSPHMQKGDYGWLYGANIIEEWTTQAGDGVELIWIASTWDPYRVILLRTHIAR